MICHSASLPCRSEPRAATTPSSRANCDRTQTAPTDGPCFNSGPLSPADASMRPKSPLYFSASRIASPSSGLQGVRLARVRLDLAIFAIRLAQKVAGVGLAVEAGDRAVDEHYGYICKPNSQSLQEKCTTVSGYTSNAQIAPNLLISIHKLSMSERRKGGTSVLASTWVGRRAGIFAHQSFLRSQAASG